MSANVPATGELGLARRLLRSHSPGDRLLATGVDEAELPVRTLQNWEQGRRRSQGPARALLQVAAEHPDALLDLVRKAR